MDMRKLFKEDWNPNWWRNYHKDKIYVIDSGLVIGEGKHEDLLIGSKVYKNFYDKQIKKN